jgi:hypothetical protein
VLVCDELALTVCSLSLPICREDAANSGLLISCPLVGITQPSI